MTFFLVYLHSQTIEIYEKKEKKPTVFIVIKWEDYHTY